MDSSPVVLLTGASGLVGRGLLRRLRGRVLAVTHRTPVAGPGVTPVRGDVTRPRFGLDEAAWRALAGRVDVVVHAAAVTGFTGRGDELARTNVDGTRHALELAAAADAPLCHVSTAFVHARTDTARGRAAVRYAASKRAGDELVRASGLPHTIVRPSVVIGDAGTGEATAFQGVHHVAEAIVRGQVPIIPFDPDWWLDTVPRDVVADGIATLVEQGNRGGEVWLTSGSRALTLRAAVDTLVETAARLGRPVPPPRFVPPELFDRLIAPVFLDALPEEMARTVTRLLDVFSAYLSAGEPMPSSLPALAARGARPLPDPRTALATSLAYWLRTTGLAGGDAEEAA
jgi:nucleoside-diphosphate-sugar epimerase